MTRKTVLALVLILPAALLLLLWAAVPVGAQSGDVLWDFATDAQGWVRVTSDSTLGLSTTAAPTDCSFGVPPCSLRNTTGLSNYTRVSPVVTGDFQILRLGVHKSGSGDLRVRVHSPDMSVTYFDETRGIADNLPNDWRSHDFVLSGVPAGPVRVSWRAGSIWVDNVRLVAEVVSPTPTPGYNPIGNLDPGEYGGTCVYTSTVGNPVLTGANILGNPSFEIYNYTTFPAGWYRYDPVQTLSQVARSSNAARSGNWGMSYEPGQYGIGQGVCRTFNIDSRTESIAVGAYVQSTEGGGTLTLRVRGSDEVGGGWNIYGPDLSGGWQKLSGVVEMQGPRTVEICGVVANSLGSEPVEERVYLDDFWVYESETAEEFNVICPAPSDAGLDPPPAPGMDFGDDVPAPAPTAFGVCYDCIRPMTLLEIGGWIKWLLCMIANLFRCELYLWLQVLNNLSFGIFGRILSLILWLPDAANVFLDWFEQSVNGSLDWLVGVWDAWRQNFVAFLRNLVQSLLNTELAQDIWVFVSWAQRAWVYLQATIMAIVSQIRALFDAAVTVVELVQTVIQGVITSWRAPPDPDVFGHILPAGAGALGPEQAEGISNSKISWLVLVALASFDAIFASFGLQYLKVVVMAVVGFGVIYWTLRQFQDILPV